MKRSGIKGYLLIPALGLFCINCIVGFSSISNTDKKVLAAEPACVDTEFFSQDMVQADQTTECLNASGTACGIQECCIYEEGAGSCQETSCKVAIPY